jgi:hypothetical protein
VNFPHKKPARGRFDEGGRLHQQVLPDNNHRALARASPEIVMILTIPENGSGR